MAGARGGVLKRFAGWGILGGWVITMIPHPLARFGGLGVAVLGFLALGTGIAAARSVDLSTARHGGLPVLVEGGLALVFGAAVATIGLAIALGAAGYAARLLGSPGGETLFTGCAMSAGGIAFLGMGGVMIARRAGIPFIMGGALFALGGLGALFAGALSIGRWLLAAG